MSLLPALACGGDEEPAGPPPPSSIVLVSGGAQTGPVGAGLPQPVVVRVSAGSAPVSGARVSFSVTTGGGSISPTSVLTDASGNATVSWTLGGTLGEQTATATVGSITPLQITATGTTGAPTTLIPVAGSTQFGVVKRPVTIRPRVKLGDAFGNPIAGQPIHFELTAGGGTVTGVDQVTDAAGTAELGGWTLGPQAGINRVLASFNANVSTEVIAIGTPASIVAQAGNGQTANAGTIAPIAPTVVALDGDGQPLANVEIAFVVENGGGTVNGPTQRTDAQGIAKVGGWILGPTPGENTLKATAAGGFSTTFTAHGIPGTPANLVAASPTSSSGIVGNFMATVPTVRVTDADGHAVAGTQVTFDVVSGGGVIASPAVQSFGLVTLAGAIAVSDFNGDATLGAWRLGPATGDQTVSASIQGVPPVTFTATAMPVPPAEYQIVVRYIGTQPTAAQKAAFDAAVARWQQVILGDVGDEHVVWEATSCFPALDELVDDLIIYAELVAIDGAGGILGSAGPCLVREDAQGNTGPTGVGRMRFDIADLQSLETTGNLDEVILHEMGHVIGIGSLWTDFGLLVGGGGSDPYFSGSAARGAWRVTAANLNFTGNIVPVENSGGPGTRDSHWRESVANNELMTGFLNNGLNPLSVFTIGSLRDMGYVVNDAVADPLELFPLLRAGPAATVQLREAPLPGDILVVRRGRVVRSIPRAPF